MMKKFLILIPLLFLIGCGGSNKYTSENPNLRYDESKCISGDCVNGYGTILYPGHPKVNKYVGEFKNNTMYGQGTYYHSNGDKYFGEFFGKYQEHGQGTYTYSNGKIWQGLWRYGHFIDVENENQILAIVENPQQRELIKDRIPEIERAKKTEKEKQRLKDLAENKKQREIKSAEKEKQRLKALAENKKKKEQEKLTPMLAKQETCKTIGFKIGTEKNGECVLKLMELETQIAASNQTIINNNSNSEAADALAKTQRKILIQKQNQELINMGLNLLFPPQKPNINCRQTLTGFTCN